MIRTNIYLTEEQEKGISEVIEKNKMGTKAQIVRNAIDEYLDKYNNTSSNESLLKEIRLMKNEDYRRRLINEAFEKKG